MFSYAQKIRSDLFGGKYFSNKLLNKIHGGGTRYNEKSNGYDSLSKECLRFLPKGQPHPFYIGPNFDIDMNKIGWFETDDRSGIG